MRREIIFSFVFHIFIVAAFYGSGLILTPRKIDLGEVIKVSLMSLPELPVTNHPPANPLDIPRAVQAEQTPAPISDKSAKPVAIKKPTPKKPKKDKKKYEGQKDTGAESKSGAVDGDANVAEASGSPFAGATVDNADFNYPYWFTQAFYKIQTNWQNPVDADGEIICVVYFQVLASGRVVETRVEKPSGIPAFDDACIYAVKRSSPFPPFPREFTDEILGITIPFKYQPGQ
jgi:TonB family protein